MKEGRNVDVFLRRLWALESQLVAAGFKPMPAWWRQTIERFYRARKRRLVVRKGRRVYASTCVAPRLGVAEAFFGGHQHVTGSPPLVFAFLSVRRDEAANRLRGIKAILDALGEKYIERAETIELVDRPVIFAVVTANHRTNVGDTVAFAWGDEVASWNDDELGANPAPLVVGRLSPALATLPDAKLFLVSSPFAIDDYHARQFDLGETELQCVAFGTTWEINQDLTEADTHAMEPDQKLWSLNYAAVPGPTVSFALDPESITAAQRVAPTDLTMMAPIVSVDFSKGRGDAVAWTRIAWAHQPPLPEYLAERRYTGFRNKYTDEPVYEWREILDDRGARQANPDFRSTPPLLLIGPIQSIVGSFWQSVSSEQLVERIAADARAWGASWIIADQMESYALESMFARHGLKFMGIPWTNPNKAAAVVRVRRWLRDRQIILPLPSSGDAAKRLDSELRSFQERLLPSGTMTYAARSGAHDDHVSAALLTPAIADALGLLPMMPFVRRNDTIANLPDLNDPNR